MQIARSRGGECLSDEYVNGHTKLTWMCSKGHRWKATPNNVKRGTWCPYCAGVAVDAAKRIEKLKHYARALGGECLSEDYIDCNTKLKWKCSKGHIWEALPSIISRKAWCPICSGRVVDGGIRLRELQDYALQRGGKLLTKQYRTVNFEVEFICSRKHKFKSTYDRVHHQNSWCPKCRTFMGEELSRSILEQMFGADFPKRRPKWLKNSDGNRLELDGYNEELGIAFEYQGVQHNREITKHFHKTRSYVRQIENDKIKRKLCLKNGVILLAIAEKDDKSNLPKTIAKLLRDNGIRPKIDASKIDIDNVYLGRDRSLEDLEQICKDKNIRLVTKSYLGSKTKHTFACNRCGTKFKNTPSKIKSGRWCPQCSKEAAHNEMREDIEVLRKIALSRGGELLSKEYVNDRGKLQWKCSKGHTWYTNAGGIKRGSWCPTCAGQPKLSIDYYKQLAKSKGGCCLSDSYVNAHTKLKWQCAKGHIWSASPNSVRRGSWCRKCAFDKN